MLIFAGIGLSGPGSLTKEVEVVIHSADQIYVERYTSPMDAQFFQDLAVEEVDREFVEDGLALLEMASNKTVVLLCYGDPMVATTHAELRVRAENRGIRTKVLHNASILSSLPGGTGLHSYKFGRSVTATIGTDPAALSLYYSLHSNLVNGLHTPILLDYNLRENKHLTPNRAITTLLEREEEQRKAVFNLDSLVIIVSRMGSVHEEIVGGSARSLKDQDFGDPPYVLILPGKLHFTEEEFLRTILKVKNGFVRDNSDNVQLQITSMLEKYIPKATEALRRARQKIDLEAKPKFNPLLTNVEAYILDAERFKNDGRFELAVLSVGYAEGLLDALRFLGELEVEW